MVLTRPVVFMRLHEFDVFMFPVLSSISGPTQYLVQSSAHPWRCIFVGLAIQFTFLLDLAQECDLLTSNDHVWSMTAASFCRVEGVAASLAPL